MQALSKISRRAGVVLFSLSTLVLSVCAWSALSTLLPRSLPALTLSKQLSWKPFTRKSANADSPDSAHTERKKVALRDIDSLLPFNWLCRQP